MSSDELTIYDFAEATVLYIRYLWFPELDMHKAGPVSFRISSTPLLSSHTRFHISRGKRISK
jgi:hypothetical protein